MATRMRFKPAEKAWLTIGAKVEIRCGRWWHAATVTSEVKRSRPESPADYGNSEYVNVTLTKPKHPKLAHERAYPTTPPSIRPA